MQRKGCDQKPEGEPAPRGSSHKTAQECPQREGQRNCSGTRGGRTGCGQLQLPALRTQALLRPKCHPVSLTGEGEGRSEESARWPAPPQTQGSFLCHAPVAGSRHRFPCLKDEDVHKHIHLAKVMKGERKSQVLLFRGQNMALPQVDTERRTCVGTNYKPINSTEKGALLFLKQKSTKAH